MRGHLDSTDVFEMFSNQSVTNFGMIDYFAQKGLVVMPQLSRLGKMERKMLPGHEFTYSHPLAAKEFVLVEDLSNTDRPGLGGSTFKLKFNSRKFDNGWRITADYHEPIALQITSDEIVRDGDFWIYTVKLLGQNAGDMSTYFNKALLRPNAKFYPLGTSGGEYNQVYSSIPEFSGGERTFMQHVGHGESQIRFSVTRDAAMTNVLTSSLQNYDNYLKVMQIFEFRPGTLGYDLSLNTLEQQTHIDVIGSYKRAYGSRADNQIIKDTILNSWLPRVEMIALKTLVQSQEVKAWWSPGGTTNLDGPTHAKESLGLFHQYMLGHISPYQINYLTLQQLETIITSRLTGREDFDPSSLKPHIQMRTGKGGLSLIHRLTQNLPSQNGLLWGVEGILKGIGDDNRKLFFDAPYIASWTTASGIRISIDWEPSLDPTTASEVVNPMLPLNDGSGGYRLSSYMFVIDDLTANNTAEDGSSNICELMYGPDWDVRKSFTNGKLAYPGSELPNGTWSKTPGIAGFQVDLELKDKAYWLKDPTKSLIIMPINPKTGKPLFNHNI